MKIPIIRSLVTCPRTGESTDVAMRCKKCRFLGWVEERKVVCRWSQEKEDLLRGERYYEGTL